MPELVEVEVVRLNMRRWLHQRTVKEVQIIRPETVIQNDGICLEDVFCSKGPLQFNRKGKALLISNSSSASGAIFRFAMTGKVVAEDEVGDRPKARIRWLVHGPGKPSLVFLDGRNLGSITTLAVQDPQMTLNKAVPGQDVWLEPLNAQTLLALINKSKRAIKPWLMDQSKVSGIGNILATEMLFLAGIAPSTPANLLSLSQAQALCATMVPLLRELLEGELSDEIVYMGEKGAVNPFQIYGRFGSPCPRCGGLLQKVQLSGRGTIWCSNCQS